MQRKCFPFMILERGICQFNRLITWNYIEVQSNPMHHFLYENMMMKYVVTHQSSHSELLNLRMILVLGI